MRPDGMRRAHGRSVAFGVRFARERGHLRGGVSGEQPREPRIGLVVRQRQLARPRGCSRRASVRRRRSRRWRPRRRRSRASREGDRAHRRRRTPRGARHERRAVRARLVSRPVARRRLQEAVVPRASTPSSRRRCRCASSCCPSRTSRRAVRRVIAGASSGRARRAAHRVARGSRGSHPGRDGSSRCEAAGAGVAGDERVRHAATRRKRAVGKRMGRDEGVAAG